MNKQLNQFIKNNIKVKTKNYIIMDTETYGTDFTYYKKTIIKVGNKVVSNSTQPINSIIKQGK